MKNKKEKLLSIRITNELYQKYVNETIKRSNKEKRIIKISEIIREILTKGL